MSGTSLDGIDLAFCKFSHTFDNQWEYKIRKCESIPYDNLWKSTLRETHNFTGQKLIETDISYGQHLGKIILEFITRNKLNPDFIASHGHTIFHEPEKMITHQIGNGQCIAGIIKKPVVYDFRTKDVLYGGQGAPLVPVGDQLLFQEYESCLNIGGFANISFTKDNERIAFDICPANFALNLISRRLGREYDKNGELAEKGNINENLLEELNNLSFYSKAYPKSLGREWFENTFPGIIKRHYCNDNDYLRTITEHIAIQISDIINRENLSNVLVTGGGAFNKFLVSLLKSRCRPFLCLPSKEIIIYKEAIVFAFLGTLRWKNEINCLASVTGAAQNNSSGLIAYP